MKPRPRRLWKKNRAAGRICFALRVGLLLGAFAGSLAGAGPDGYELIGRITWKDRGFSRSAPPLVVLDGAVSPYSAVMRADPTGRFKFKNLVPDMYTLTVYVARAGEYRRTVEVSPSLADTRKRIFVELNFEPNLGSRALHTVSSAQLSVPSKALKEFEKALKKLGRRDADGAVAHLKKTVELAPQFAEAWNTLGTLAYKESDYRQAESYFREALKHEPGYYPSRVNLGGVLLNLGRMEEALPLNKDAVETRPDDALAHVQLGLNHYYLGQYTEAEKHLKHAASLDPHHFSYPHLTLARIYLLQKDIASAERTLNEFLSLHPDAQTSPAVRKHIEAIRSQLAAEHAP